VIFVPEKKCCVQKFQDASCTFEIRAVFGDKITLDEILAQRALQEPKTLDLKEETT